MDTVSRDFVDTLTKGSTCMLATLGQSRDGHSVPGFRGYSDIGVHMYVDYLRTIPGWTQCPGISWIL